jgi:hypothetical protein
MSSSDRIRSFIACCSIKRFVIVSGVGTGLGIVMDGSHIGDCRICLCGSGVVGRCIVCVGRGGWWCIIGCGVSCVVVGFVVRLVIGILGTERVGVVMGVGAEDVLVCAFS